MKKKVFKIESGSYGEIDFVGEVEVVGNLSDWCNSYFESERDSVLEDEDDYDEDYVEEFFAIAEVEEDEVYAMCLGEERAEYYIDMNSEMFKTQVESWKELGWSGDFDDLSRDMIQDFMLELDTIWW